MTPDQTIPPTPPADVSVAVESPQPAPSAPVTPSATTAPPPTNAPLSVATPDTPTLSVPVVPPATDAPSLTAAPPSTDLPDVTATPITTATPSPTSSIMPPQTDTALLSFSQAVPPQAAPQTLPPATAPVVPSLSAMSAEAPPQFVPTETTETVAPNEAAALPELPKGEPPRALVPGAFLKLQYEIKQVLARGMTNLYLADAGSYSDATPKIIAERLTPAPKTVSDTPTNDAEQLEAGALPGEALSDNASQAPLVEGPTPTLADLKPQAADTRVSPTLFPVPEETFAQEGRDYAVFEYFASTSLQDHREPTNDERYLQLMAQLCGGLAEMETHNLHADFGRDLLRVTENGELRFLGFTDDGEPLTQSATDPMEQLRALNAFLLGRALSEERTARLDDPFGALALSDEVKAFATMLENSKLSSPSVALDELRDMGAGRVPHAVSALMSDVGMEREVNEDSGFVLKTQRAAHLGSYAWELYVVADGMGGHEGGEIASERTLQALQAAFFQRATLNWSDNAKVRAALLEIITEVNEAVVKLTQEPKYMAMRNKPGSTLTFALRLGARVFFGNVGDSRGYLWNAQTGLKRATKDHSYVQTLIDAGQITDDEAWDHPDGSIITAHMGDMKGRTKDVFLRLVKPGDKLLLVSDGVVDMLRDVEIAPFLQESDPEVVCRNLVNASNAAGGADNITALCVVFS